MTKTVKTFQLWKDEASLMNRYKRVSKGTIGSFRQTEQMLVVSAAPPAVQPVGFQHWRGSTAGTLMGPIILPDLSESWEATWADKKDISRRPA